MFETFRKLINLLTPREKRRFYLLLGMIMVMGLAEMVSVASILPFLAVLADPGIIETNGRLARVYAALGFQDHQSFLVFLGVGVFVLVVVGLLFSTLTQYLIFRFTFMRGYSISGRLLYGYLHQPYTWYLNRHSAKLGATVLSEVNQVITQAMVPAMRMLSQATVVVFLIALLVLVQPLAAGIAALVLGGSYLAIYLGVRRYLTRLGRERHAANQERFRIAGEAMGGIKDVKLMGLEGTYLGRFQAPSLRMAVAAAASNVIGDLPRNILKAIGYGSLIFFVLFLLVTGNGTLGDVLPVLGLYAFAGMRLFPAFQQIFVGITMLRFSRPVLDKLEADFRENAANAAALPRAPAPLRLRERLELAEVRYVYPEAERPSLESSRSPSRRAPPSASSAAPARARPPRST